MAELSAARLLSRGARTAWGILLDLLYPPHCALCSSWLDPEHCGEHSVLCPQCLGDIIAPPSPCCPICSHPVVPGMPCPNCSGRSWNLAMIVPSCRYSGEVRGMIQRFKYGKEIALTRPLAILLRRALSDPRIGGRRFDAVVPVPLHPVRERERGFNQADLLAGELSRYLGVPRRRLLRRILPTPQQAGFDREKRMENLRGAFALRRDVPPDSSLLLVDDVATTGVTLDTCAAVLNEAGAAAVCAVVVARG